MWTAEIALLRAANVELALGLTTSEILAVEHHLGVSLPPDLSRFLRHALPVGANFPNWRDLGSQALAEQLAWPVKGILFDIENNAFWWASWGSRPSQLTEALELARERLSRVPKLVPVFAHRYMPTKPAKAGNPVLSVYQTNIVYYGSDLQRYLHAEFGALDHRDALLEPPRRVPFWSDLLESA